MNSINQRLLLALFAGYTIKSLAFGSTFSDAAIILVLAAAHFLINHYAFDKQFNELKQELTGIKDAVKTQDQAIADLKSSLAGVKIAGGFRNVK